MNACECGFPRVESNCDEQRDECESDDRVAIDEKLDRLSCDSHSRADALEHKKAVQKVTVIGLPRGVLGLQLPNSIMIEKRIEETGPVVAQPKDVFAEPARERHVEAFLRNPRQSCGVVHSFAVPEQYFALFPVHLQLRRKTPAKLDEFPIQVRYTSFKTVSPAHAVYLHEHIVR